eukprot:TRINITY_DN10734_c0_g1_i1.p1 TRINITY_DN10734_c0_g1~~TRINITY_DN10734_c0_g1_i1.p1  ORF type:complete len:316 (-),score=51.74 TRINITY_DN10734_c0_g1_i1:103-1050(-)
MYSSFVLVLVFVGLCFSDPTPPTSFPPTWYTWVVTSVVKVGVDKPLYDVGQLVMYDSLHKVSCRYFQQNLIQPVSARPVDLCDYNSGSHYAIGDVLSNSSCLGVTSLPSNLSAVGYPPEYLAAAKFLGVNKVAQKDCNHFNAMNIQIGGRLVQMDVWTTTDTSFPCEISITDSSSSIITTWAFDGFDQVIPPNAVSQCTAAKLVCTPSIMCRAKTTASDPDLQAALGWVCTPPHLDCSPIQPGGAHYYPNTLRDHCDWAFNSYFELWKASQGPSACDFSGNAELYTSNSTMNALPKELNNYFDIYSPNLVCERSS